MSCVRICPDIHYFFPFLPIKNTSPSMIPAPDPFYMRKEREAGEVHTCHILLLSFIHIKKMSSKNPLMTLITHSLTSPVSAHVQEEKREERRPWVGYIFRTEPRSNPDTLQLCPLCVPCP